jgi:hypothetical protein
MKASGTLLGLMLVTLTAFAADAGAPSPKDVVQSFYELLAHPLADLGQDLDRLSPRLTPHLKQLVAQARAADAAYSRKFPDEAPPFEHGTCVFYGGGDCDISSFSVLGVRKRRAAAQVTVELSLQDANRPGDPPYRWRNIVQLKAQGDHWAIDDIRYFDGGASDTLRAIVKDAQ